MDANEGPKKSEAETDLMSQKKRVGSSTEGHGVLRLLFLGAANLEYYAKY